MATWVGRSTWKLASDHSDLCLHHTGKLVCSVVLLHTVHFILLLSVILIFNNVHACLNQDYPIYDFYIARYFLSQMLKWEGLQFLLHLQILVGKLGEIPMFLSPPFFCIKPCSFLGLFMWPITW